MPSVLGVFETDLRPDGRPVAPYPTDPLPAGTFIEVRVAMHHGGTPPPSRSTGQEV